jgi:hypothetical protein
MGIKVLKVLNNDFVLNNSDGLETLTGVDALAQIMNNRLSMFLGEWFYTPLSGFDWLGLVNQKTFLEKRARSMVRKAILEDTRIINITKLDISYENSTRTITIDWKAESSEGLIAGTVTQ